MHPETLAECDRYFVLITTEIFGILGTVGILFGLKTLVTTTNGHEILQPIDLIIGGFVLVVISIIGFYGTYKNKFKLVNAYGGMLIFLVASRTFFFVLGLTIRKNPKFSPEEVRRWFDRYEYNSTSTPIVDDLQKMLHCCGYTGPQSMLRADGTYPSSCCSYTTTECYTPYSSACEPLLSGRGYLPVYFTVIIVMYPENYETTSKMLKVKFTKTHSSMMKIMRKHERARTKNHS